jgi:hypothetical protein
MKVPYLSLAVLVAAIMLIQSAGFAREDETAPPDTAATTDLFNPPHVLRPEQTSGVEPGQVAEGPEPAAGPARTDQPEKKRGCASCSQNRNPRAGGGGQFDIGVAFLNLSEINAQVRQMGIPQLSDKVLIVGGRGYGRIGHLIIGGAGYGATVESSGIPDCCARYARLDFGYGGLLLGASTCGTRYELIGGVLLGGGQAKITRRRNSKEIAGWDDAWNPFKKDGPDSVGSDDLNITSEITGNFIAVEPFISLKYWLSRFMALDFSASYLHAEISRGQWKLDEVKIPDSPESDLGGPVLKVGVHFGV